MVRQRDGRGQRRSGRRYQIVALLISVLVLITAGSLALTLYGHTRAAAHGGYASSPRALRAEVEARNHAAAWVAGQVSRTVVVSCDPVMCRALRSHRVPASDLYELGPDTPNPLRSEIIVATALVRSYFGTVLSSVYAPAVIASFGSGHLRIDIRQIAPHGAAAYKSMLNADLLERKISGAELLRSNRIAVSTTARRQLSAGQVDTRLLIAMAGMAAVHPIYIVAFGSVAPGADPDMPLRFADVTQTSHARHATPRSPAPAFVRSMVRFLRAQHAPYLPASMNTVRMSAGQAVLRIEFAAPSPLNLLGPH